MNISISDKAVTCLEIEIERERLYRKARVLSHEQVEIIVRIDALNDLEKALKAVDFRPQLQYSLRSL